MAEHEAHVWQCTSEEYHRDPAISQSKIKQFLRDPEGFYEQSVDFSADSPDSTASMQFGVDAERLLFYGETPGEVIPNDVLEHRKNSAGGMSHYKTGPRWKEFKSRMEEQHGEDVVLMKADEWEKRVPPILICRDKVRAHDRANKLIFGHGEPQLALKWVDPLFEGLLDEHGNQRECKCQLDMLHGGLDSPKAIVDYKTAMDATPGGFRKAVSNFGYHYQAWWYQRACEFLCGETLPVVFVVSKNKPSYHCETYDLDPRWYQLAKRDMLDGIARLRVAFQEGVWTSPTHGKIHRLEPSPWDK